MKQRFKALGLQSVWSRLRLKKALSAATAAIVAVAAFSIINLKEAPKAEAAGTWSSGACCAGVPNGSFGSWRGSPATIGGTWQEREASLSMTSLSGEYGSWTGDIDLAVGALMDGQNWGAAANGSYDGQWRTSLQKINQYWGQKKTIYIRFAHEFNGGWYPWSVNSGDNENFKKAWIRYYNLVQSELVAKGRSAKLVLAPNGDPVINTISAVWPGDQYVDVVGVDMYDQYPSLKSQSDWDSNFMATKMGGPKGIGAYQAFAKSHGKPMAFSEWGLMKNNSGIDNPTYIKLMHTFMSTNAGSGPGNVIYDVYFNEQNGFADKTALYPSTSSPNAAAMYKSLKWGTGVSNPGTNPTPAPTTAVTPKPATPIPSTPAPSGSNILSGKTLTSSAGENADEPGNAPANANDGDTSTRWISAAEDNVSLTADLGSSYNLNRVDITWAGDTTKNYDIQVSSDGQSWTTVKSAITTNQQTETISSTFTATGRYLRVVAKDRWNTGYGNSIWEIAAYGTAGSGGGSNGCAALKNPKADLNGDCKVNIMDLSILLTNWLP